MAGRTYKKKTYKRRKTTTMVRQMKRFGISVPELKTYSTSGSYPVATTVWQYFSCLAMVATGGCPKVSINQGTDASSRIGNRIFVKKIEVMIMMTPGTSMPAGGTQCRAVMYHNKECNGTLIASTDLWDYDQLMTTRLQARLAKASVLKDHSKSMIVTGTDSTGVIKAVGPTCMAHFIVYPKKTINYVGNTTAGAITDLLKDDYGFGYCALNATSVSIAVALKVSFTDL